MASPSTPIWSKASLTHLNRFRSIFGTDPRIVADIWNRIQPWRTISSVAKPHHLLWALLFMKSYATESLCAAMCGVTEKTFRKWQFIFCEAISNLKDHVIIWDNRFKNHQGNHALVTVDGTDCRILEPFPFWPGWFSHKFRGPGVRYEVAVSICGGDIVWVYGPFPCGQWPDIKIFRHAMINRLLPWEMVEADRGYGGCPNHVYTPFRIRGERGNEARARHETINSRFKRWGILRFPYRHDLQRHGVYFNAIAVVTQMEIDAGYPVWRVNY